MRQILGIKDMISFNEILLKKWRLTLYNQKGIPWSEIVEARYRGGEVCQMKQRLGVVTLFGGGI